MGEWWTYRLADFLMFSPRAYARLVEGYNREFWPAQAVVLVAALALMGLAMRSGSRRWSIAASVLFALAWANVGVSFFLERYRDIFTAAAYLAGASAVQAAAVAAAAAAAQPPRRQSAPWWLAVATLVAYPAATGGAEWFGFMPDPTALATLFFVGAAQRPAWLRGVLCAIPLAVLAVGWATRAALAGAASAAT